MEKKDYLFDDMFDKPVEFTEENQKNQNYKNIPGNVRLAKGLY